MGVSDRRSEKRLVILREDLAEYTGQDASVVMIDHLNSASDEFSDSRVCN